VRGKKRKPNPNLVRSRHSYTFAEIAEVYGIHVRTVQSWRKKGMRVIDEMTKPYLVLGYDVRVFLKERAQKRRSPLEIGEFFCPRCRGPRRSQPGKLFAEATGKTLGPRFRQVLIRGVCTVCGQTLVLFSSDRKVEEWRKGGWC
jgi:hypothetical protein